MGAVETERKSKEFWAITEFWNVERVVGWECPPNDGIWWVPKLGYSMSEKHHLFGVFDDAKAAGLKDLSAKIEKLKQSYNRLVDAKEPR